MQPLDLGSPFNLPLYPTPVNVQITILNTIRMLLNLVIKDLRTIIWIFLIERRQTRLLGDKFHLPTVVYYEIGLGFDTDFLIRDADLSKPFLFPNR